MFFLLTTKIAAQTMPTTATHAPITRPVVCEEEVSVFPDPVLSEAEEPNPDLERFDESPLFLLV